MGKEAINQYQGWGAGADLYTRFKSTGIGVHQFAREEWHNDRLQKAIEGVFRTQAPYDINDGRAYSFRITYYPSGRIGAFRVLANGDEVPRDQYDATLAESVRDLFRVVRGEVQEGDIARGWIEPVTSSDEEEGILSDDGGYGTAGKGEASGSSTDSSDIEATDLTASRSDRFDDDAPVRGRPQDDDPDLDDLMARDRPYEDFVLGVELTDEDRQWVGLIEDEPDDDDDGSLLPDRRASQHDEEYYRFLTSVKLTDEDTDWVEVGSAMRAAQARIEEEPEVTRAAWQKIYAEIYRLITDDASTKMLTDDASTKMLIAASQRLTDLIAYGQRYGWPLPFIQDDE